MISCVLQLGLSDKEVHALYQDLYDRCIYIKFHSQGQMENFIGDNTEVDFKYSDGTSTKVAVSSARGMLRYVRLFNLPPEIGDKQVADILQKYGEIRTMRREKYSNDTKLPVLSGVRGIYIEVTKEIPQFIFIQNIKTRVFYDGMKEKCFKCGADTHKKVDCPLLAVKDNQRHDHVSQGTAEEGHNFAEYTQPACIENSEFAVPDSRDNTTITRTSYCNVTKSQTSNVKFDMSSSKAITHQMQNLNNLSKARILESDTSSIDTETELGQKLPKRARGRATKKSKISNKDPKSQILSTVSISNESDTTGENINQPSKMEQL